MREQAAVAKTSPSENASTATVLVRWRKSRSGGRRRQRFWVGRGRRFLERAARLRVAWGSGEAGRGVLPGGSEICVATITFRFFSCRDLRSKL